MRRRKNESKSRKRRHFLQRKKINRSRHVARQGILEGEGETWTCRVDRLRHRQGCPRKDYHSLASLGTNHTIWTKADDKRQMTLIASNFMPYLQTNTHTHSAQYDSPLVVTWSSAGIDRHHTGIDPEGSTDAASLCETE
ncbi:hypothetical protein ElyMa_003658600 [Elysia marginata]|uniref:Uncharacterized protein n=1 Tax=Elysia marginata TaxID=1093978 RepID=A0AAV4EWM6_9GAST|nr:hypothetical protein ElyMa_003658600 [Elysia marginata]